MAKLNHVLFGQAKGKVGGMVLQRYEGMNIAREKPITVKNPQSTKQTEQRAKFKLASQFVGIFSEIVNIRLSEFSIYTRKRRAEAIKAVLSVAEINAGQDSIAEIIFEEAVASINAKSMSEYTAPAVTTADSNYSVTAPTGSEIFGVITAYNENGELVDRKVVSGTSAGSANTFAQLTTGDSQRAIFLYTVAETEDGRATLTNIVTNAEDFEVAILRSVASGDLKVSAMTGVTVS